VTIRDMVDAKGESYTLITKWRKNRGATQILLDSLDRPLMRTFHPEREGDAWEEMKAKLELDKIVLQTKP
jgi:hypothetical protein